MGGEYHTFCCAHGHDIDDGVAEGDGLELFTKQPGLGEEDPHASRLVIRPIPVDVYGEVLGDPNVARVQEGGEDAEDRGVVFREANRFVGALLPLVAEGSDEEVGMVLGRFGVDVKRAAVGAFTDSNGDGRLFRAGRCVSGDYTFSDRYWHPLEFCW